MLSTAADTEKMVKDDTSQRIEIPDKFYFKIGEVSRIVGVPSSVLRFWETEFDSISPKRTAAGQRRYRRRDVRLLLRIKQLLYEQKFTIEGARLHLKQKGSRDRKAGRKLDTAQVKTALIEIRELIDAHLR